MVMQNMRFRSNNKQLMIIITHANKQLVNSENWSLYEVLPENRTGFEQEEDE